MALRRFGFAGLAMAGAEHLVGGLRAGVGLQAQCGRAARARGARGARGGGQRRAEAWG